MSLVSGGAWNFSSMADPANAPAAASTSRCKRVLPSQSRGEAKRLCTSSDKDHSPETSRSHHKTLKHTSKVRDSICQNGIAMWPTFCHFPPNICLSMTNRAALTDKCCLFVQIVVSGLIKTITSAYVS